MSFVSVYLASYPFIFHPYYIIFHGMCGRKKNEDRHGQDKTEREQLLVERSLLQTEELYKIRLDVLLRHHNLFYDKYTQHKEVEKTSRGLNL